MVVEKGLRQKAEVTAVANVERAQAVIAAEREKEVAELEAAKKVAVAEQTKLEAETKASQQVEVARLYYEDEKLKTSAAEEQAKQIQILAIAEEERIEKAGAVTERDKVLAQIAARRDVDVAAQLAKIDVPRVTITGGKDGGNPFSELIQIWMMQQSGIIPKDVLNPALAKKQPSGD